LKSKKLLSILLAGVMVLSMAACGGDGSEGTNETTQQPTNTTVEGASIDFEDGKSAFVMMSTKPRKADDSTLSVKDFNGSKALFVENHTGGELYIGIDVDALLGDKVTEVRSIQMDIGTEYADGTFSASAGNLYAYTGADLKENKLAGWSVYMANKNPKTATFAMEDADGNPISFTAGNNNYIVLVKDDDTGAVASSMYLDNIAFIDANGSVIAADSSAVMEEPFEGYRKVVKEEEPAAPGSVTVALDESYMGDWAATTAIPAAEFAAFSGDVTVTLKYEVQSGYDYYLLKPIDLTDWTGMESYYTDLAVSAAVEGQAYHLQDDGFIVIDSMAAGEITFTISAAGVQKLVTGGAGLAGQTYGATVYEAVLTGTAGGGSTSKTVAMDESYAGDWSATVAIPAAEFAGLSGDVTVTFKYEVTGDKDYYLVKPIDLADWAGMETYYTDLTASAAAAEGATFHLQDDGFIVIDSMADGEITFTISAAGVEKIVNGGAGLAGQTYGVVVYEAVLTGSAPAAAATATTVAMDDDYMGDWAAVTAIPVTEFAGKTGDVKVTFKFEVTGDKDYYLFKPMDLADWGDMQSYYTDLAPSAAVEGQAYHLQDDGFIVIDTMADGEITVTINAAGIEKIVNGAAGLSGQTYGLIVYEAEVQ